MIFEVHTPKLCGEYIVGTHGMVQCVDDGVPRDEDVRLWNPLGEEIRVRGRRRCKMQGRDAARKATVHLLGER